MGWWDSGVFGGDEPWDYMGEIGDLIGYNDYEGEEFKSMTAIEHASPEDKEFVRKGINEHFDEIIEMCKKLYNNVIFMQVLGGIIVVVGADLPEDIRAKIIDCCDRDEWAKEDSSRHEKMEILKEQVRFHKPGKMVSDLGNKGLFEKFDECMGV